MKRKKGFTLVEAIVTIVLLTILASISVPMYENYVNKGIDAEAYTFLGSIRDAQLLYRSEYGYFWGACSNNGYGNSGLATSYLPVLHINAKLNKYCTWFTMPNSRYYDPNVKFLASTPKPTGKTLNLLYDLVDGATYYEN